MRQPGASIANLFIGKAVENHLPLIPLKIQQLIYLTHGYSLAEHDEPLLNECFQAWPIGPVLASIYHQCKRFRGAKGITKLIMDTDWMSGEKREASPVFDPIALDCVDLIWDNYSIMEPHALRVYTHDVGSPWDVITKGGDVIIRNKSIPDDMLRDYFRQYPIKKSKIAA